MVAIVLLSLFHLLVFSSATFCLGMCGGPIKNRLNKKPVPAAKQMPPGQQKPKLPFAATPHPPIDEEKLKTAVQNTPCAEEMHKEAEKKELPVQSQTPKNEKSETNKKKSVKQAPTIKQQKPTDKVPVTSKQSKKVIVASKRMAVEEKKPEIQQSKKAVETGKEQTEKKKPNEPPPQSNQKIAISVQQTQKPKTDEGKQDDEDDETLKDIRSLSQDPNQPPTMDE
ncbi:hypothetical protein M3Y96_01242800 [Aphelenchoides besseyi]|nr:hypothetical protein M3Y96_01242800 [Aphelenchoides besseyi]